MEDLLSYTKYKNLICIFLEGFGDIYVSTSSNRKINVLPLKHRAWTDVVNEKLELFVWDIFPTYFKLQSKDNSQLTETDKFALSSIFNYFKELGEEISRSDRISLDTRQILFMLPVDWVEDSYEDMLRTLFLEAGWITPKDDNNKLMLVPFIETFVDYIQKTTDCRLQFGREKKYILFSVHQTDERKKISYTCTSFQMQSAKELIAVSRKLASSEFLLAPTVLKSQSIDLSDLDHVLRLAIKEILTAMQIRQEKKAQSVSNEEDEKELYASEVAHQLVYKLTEIHSCSKDRTRVVDDFVEGVNLNLYQLQELRNLSCHQFMKEISLAANVQEYTGEIVDFMRNFCDEYGAISYSPNGIQDIVFHYGVGGRDHYFFYINEALIQAKLVKPENGFISTPIFRLLADSAMQKPMKMIEIANAILPPVFLDEENVDDGVYNKVQENSNSLLPLNSFYLQVTIGEQQIDFTLNKVVKEPSSKNTAQLFTVQQREIRRDDIVAVASDNMWSHYQLLESGGRLGLLSNCCQEHETIELSARHYECFNSNIKKLIEAWCQCRDTWTNEELDAYHSVYIDIQCACALKITRRMLLDMGLTPAIIDFGATIVGAAFSNGCFGLYPISAIIIRKWMLSIVNPYYFRPLGRLLKETLQKGFQIHHRGPRLFFESDTDSIIAQYLGTGAYTYIASTTFSIRLHVESKTNASGFALHDEHRLLSQNLAFKYGFLKYARSSKWDFAVISDYIPIIEKGFRFPRTGITKTVFLKEGGKLKARVDTLEPSPYGTIHNQIISLNIPDFIKGYSLISVSILPQYHTSSIKVSLSRIATLKEVDRSGTFVKRAAYYDERSVDIHERLHLKRQQE